MDYVVNEVRWTTLQIHVEFRVENCKPMWNLASRCKVYAWTQWAPYGKDSITENLNRFRLELYFTWKINVNTVPYKFTTFYTKRNTMWDYNFSRKVPIQVYLSSFSLVKSPIERAEPIVSMHTLYNVKRSSTWIYKFPCKAKFQLKLICLIF